MSKKKDKGPKWKHAPDWANYKAQDKDGSWCWYQFKPVKAKTNEPDMWVTENGGLFETVCDAEDWGTTLRKRPKRK